MIFHNEETKNSIDVWLIPFYAFMLIKKKITILIISGKSNNGAFKYFVMLWRVGMFFKAWLILYACGKTRYISENLHSAICTQITNTRIPLLARRAEEGVQVTMCRSHRYDVLETLVHAQYVALCSSRMQTCNALYRHEVRRAVI